MQMAYLNGSYLPLHEAKISPLDRGFLFGDGIYEVIPFHGRRPIGLSLHLERMKKGLGFLGIESGLKAEEWLEIIEKLLGQNEDENLCVYIQVSRGADKKRTHAYPKGVAATIFAYAFPQGELKPMDRFSVRPSTAITREDLRWKRCHIKSTSLLGNVMHYQQGYAEDHDECILFNVNNELTEGSSSNVFVVKDGRIATPLLNEQILPGITRNLIIRGLYNVGIMVEERIVNMDEVRCSDELWITSSTKEIAPVVNLDGQLIGDGKVGEVWESTFKTYNASKFDE